jgi:hypothetical protein
VTIFYSELSGVYTGFNLFILEWCFYTILKYINAFNIYHYLAVKMTKHILSLLIFFLVINHVFSQVPGLFDSDQVMEFTLRGDLKTLFKDRGDDSKYYKATLHYTADQGAVDIPIRIKTRGHFRKQSGNCQYPPLQLNFAKSSTPKNSVFSGQDKMKLVTNCQGDQYVINEYLVYKLYNLLTPKSFKARLVSVVFEDTVKNKISEPSYGILLEEEAQMAARNNSVSIEKIGIVPQATQKEVFLKMAVFEYMIGNTDWSVQYQQNIKLITDDSTKSPYTVPYDFDHAGIVGAPYAHPAPELQMSSTRQRRYRGYCVTDMNEFNSTFEVFNQLKADFYKLYDGSELLSTAYQKKTLKFLDQFYEIINDPKKAKQEFSYPCDPSGTGNVVIKGLRKN